AIVAQTENVRSPSRAMRCIVRPSRAPSEDESIEHVKRRSSASARVPTRAPLLPPPRGRRGRARVRVAPRAAANPRHRGQAAPSRSVHRWGTFRSISSRMQSNSIKDAREDLRFTATGAPDGHFSSERLLQAWELWIKSFRKIIKFNRIRYDAVHCTVDDRPAGGTHNAETGTERSAS